MKFNLALTMSLLSLAVAIVIILTSTASFEVKNNLKSNYSVQNFKEYVTNVIRDQTTKIQTLLKKIQWNAQSVLARIENVKQDRKFDVNIKKPLYYTKRNDNQVESSLKVDASTEVTESRNFNNHYATSAYGASGNANYGASTYHHHSIGFDPINIVVSMSLLSFLLQALQGLLGRTRLPTQVVEARNAHSELDWQKKIQELTKDEYYFKKKYLKQLFPK